MKQRWLEAGKNLLIVLLLCSAALLTLYITNPGPFAQLPGVRRVAAALGSAPQTLPQLETRQAAAVEAVRPTVLSVSTENGRVTAQYDTAASDAMYEALGRFLGEALGTAQEAAACPRTQWTAALSGPGLFYGFPGTVSLSALADWLDADGSRLSGQARAFAVYPEDEAVSLLIFTAADCFRCSTQVSAEALAQALEGYGADGSLFAFEGAADFPQLAGLDPLCLICMGSPAVPAVTAQSSLNVERTAVRLGFNPYNGTSYTTTDGQRVFSESGSRLVISGSRLTYSPTALSAPSGSDTDLIETARSLLEELVGGDVGAGRLYLTDVSHAGNQTTLTFSYLVWGIPVELSGGCGASALFTGQSLTTLQAEGVTFTLGDTMQSMMPALQAAALAGSGARLELAYLQAGDSLQCGWQSVN